MRNCVTSLGKSLLRALLATSCFVVLTAFAESGSIAVLYPEVREPYKSIFRDIVGGIKQESDRKVITYSLTTGDELQAIKEWLGAKNPRAVILLGNRGKYLASKLGLRYTTVNGAAILSDENIQSGLSGISLTPSPRRLFFKLKELVPQVQRVTVIYHQPSNGWLIDRASHAAAELEIDLVALSATDVREAARMYRQVLATQDNGKDAVWLLQGDPTLDERSLLPTILDEAWGRYSVVFSSNPSHVKRGALFSLFPDNFNMGKSLARKTRILIENGEHSAEPLDDVLVAVNLRTAEHLNLKLTRSDAKGFDLVFPSK